MGCCFMLIVKVKNITVFIFNQLAGICLFLVFDFTYAAFIFGISSSKFPFFKLCSTQNNQCSTSQLYLSTDGIFLGTIPNANKICALLRAHNGAWSNDVCAIKTSDERLIDTTLVPPTFGATYTFKLG